MTFEMVRWIALAINTVGAIGSIVAAIALWSDHRGLAWLAIGCLVAQFVGTALPFLAIVAVVGAIGLTTFAFTDSTAASIIVSLIAFGLATYSGITHVRIRQSLEIEAMRQTLPPHVEAELQAQEAQGTKVSFADVRVKHEVHQFRQARMEADSAQDADRVLVGIMEALRHRNASEAVRVYYVDAEPVSFAEYSAAYRPAMDGETHELSLRNFQNNGIDRQDERISHLASIRFADPRIDEIHAATLLTLGLALTSSVASSTYFRAVMTAPRDRKDLVDAAEHGSNLTDRRLTEARALRRAATVRLHHQAPDLYQSLALEDYNEYVFYEFEEESPRGDGDG